jgi:hypothetical protein
MKRLRRAATKYKRTVRGGAVMTLNRSKNNGCWVLGAIGIRIADV